MKIIIYKITILVLFAILLGACNGHTISIIRNGLLITDEGKIEQIKTDKEDESNDEEIIEDEIIEDEPLTGLPIAKLRNIGDKAIVYFGERFNLDVEIDTNAASIDTYIDNEKQRVIFTVISKDELKKVVLINLCDYYIIRDTSIKIDIYDKYNYNKKHKKKVKVVIVPILDNNCEISGYLVRYDKYKIPEECKKGIINDIESRLTNCHKETIKCNCPECILFNIPCP